MIRKLIPIAATLIILSGCTAPNPHYSALNPKVDAVTGETNSPAPFVADPRVQQYVDTAKTLNQATAPVNPYSPLTGQAIEILGAAAVGISGWIARYKSQKALATQTAVTNVMAQGVVKAGAVQQVSEVASSTPHFAAVVNHINEATP